VEWY